MKKMARTLRKINKAIRKQKLDTMDTAIQGFKAAFRELTISDKVIIMRGTKITLPNSLINRALGKAHQGSHPGISGMKRRIWSHFWFPGADRHI